MILLRKVVASILMGSWLVGCATQRDVAEIVARSNAAMLTAELGANLDLLTNVTRGATAPIQAQEASAKIDSFIQAHPDQPATIAALRIRQGVLLMNQKQFNLARAAFQDAPLEQLHTERDQAIKRVSEHLLWWAQNSVVDPFPTAAIPRAQIAMKALDDEVAKLSRTGGGDQLQTRDLLAEIRAWIALTVTRRSDEFDQLRSRLEEAMNTYGDTLTSSDLSALSAPESELRDRTITQEGRRRLRAKAVLTVARERAQELERENRRPTFKSPQLQEFITGGR